MMDQLALDLYLAALCAIGFLAWIARDVTANIVGYIGKPAGADPVTYSALDRDAGGPFKEGD